MGEKSQGKRAGGIGFCLSARRALQSTHPDIFSCFSDAWAKAMSGGTGGLVSCAQLASLTVSQAFLSVQRKRRERSGSPDGGFPAVGTAVSRKEKIDLG